MTDDDDDEKKEFPEFPGVTMIRLDAATPFAVWLEETLNTLSGKNASRCQMGMLLEADDGRMLPVVITVELLPPLTKKGNHAKH